MSKEIPFIIKLIMVASIIAIAYFAFDSMRAVGTLNQMQNDTGEYSN